MLRMVEVEVWQLTDEEFAAARECVLAELDCSYAELKAMHDAGHYETNKHFKAWIAIGD